LGQVKAVLDTYYPGQNGAEATARLLFGDVNPSGKLTQTFPASYLGIYFYADFCGGWIRKMDPLGPSLTIPPDAADGFATGISSPVDLRVGPDGALYYLARGVGAVGRIQYTATAAPTITQQPANQHVAPGASARRCQCGA